MRHPTSTESEALAGLTDAIAPSPPDEGSDSDGARIARLFEMTSDLLATVSLDGRFTLLNPAWEQVLGWTREELLARPIQELIHPDDAEQTLGLMRAGSRHPAHLENFTNRYRHRDGSWRWLLWSARCDGDTWYAAARDMTDRMWLERQALHDPLTRLPNRLLLMDRTRQALTRLHRSEGAVALLFIDLDRFKAINDNFGHEIGDQVLVCISERLAEMMRDSDTVARLGGDEFVILAQDIDELLPASFLPLATDSELIVQIGAWVLHSACAQAAAWYKTGVSIPISVNVAARELSELDLADRVRDELRRFRLPGRALCLEVSEDAVLRDPDRAREALAEVKQLGVAVALDNFGAGNSSLSLPRNLPLDMLKLDRALIHSFEHDREARAVVAAIVALAHEAG